MLSLPHACHPLRWRLLEGNGAFEPVLSRACCPPRPLQCVFGDGKAVKAGDVSLWVGGKWHGVKAVLVDSGAGWHDLC